MIDFVGSVFCFVLGFFTSQLSRPFLLMMMVRCDSSLTESDTTHAASGYFVNGCKSSSDNPKVVVVAPVTHSMMITESHTTGIWPLDLEGHTRNIRPDTEQYSRTRSGTWP